MTNILQGYDNLKGKVPEKISEPIHAENIYQRFMSYMSGGSLRVGQAWMNALYYTDHKLWMEICGSNADCFYDDRKIEAFKTKVFGKE